MGENRNAQAKAEWIFGANGTEIRQKVNGAPGLAIGNVKFEGVILEGTMFVKAADDDWIGAIFSYQVKSKL